MDSTPSPSLPLFLSLSHNISHTHTLTHTLTHTHTHYHTHTYTHTHTHTLSRQALGHCAQDREELERLRKMLLQERESAQVRSCQ